MSETIVQVPATVTYFIVGDVDNVKTRKIDLGFARSRMLGVPDRIRAEKILATYFGIDPQLVVVTKVELG